MFTCDPKKLIHILVLISLVLVAGCTSKNKLNEVFPQEKELALANYKKVMSEAQHDHLDEIESAKISNYQCNHTDSPNQVTDVVIDLELHEADLREALSELSILADISIVSDFTVEGYVSTDINGASFEQALNMILSSGNYGYKIFEHHVLVGSQNAGDPSYHLLSETCFYTPVYLTPEQLRDLLPSYYQQFVNINSPATSISVVASRQIQQRMQRDILLLDKRPQQVQLELTIVEVNKEVMQALGFNWQKAVEYYANYQEPRYSYSVGNNSYVLPRGAQRAFLNAIQAYQNTGQARIKAMPSIVTLDGRSAKFQSLKTQWLNEVNGVASTNSKAIEVSYGVQMTIIPKIADTHAIQLEIVSASVSDLITNHVGKQVLVNHSIASSIRVATGHTLIVGGLINLKERTLQSGIAGVGNIPLLGNLFQHKQNETEQTEILIVIKPTLIDS